MPDSPAKEGFDPQDPANASGLVVYLASDASSYAVIGDLFTVIPQLLEEIGTRKAQ